MSKPEAAVIGLVLHPSKPVEQSIDTVAAFARERGVRMLAQERDRHRVPAEIDVVSDARFNDDVEGLVALGGDGTMLGAMRLMIDRPVPVLGVNHGNLGFLVEVSPAELPTALGQLAAGDFSVEQYGCLDIHADGAELATRVGFNDVVLGRASRGGAVSVDLEINDVAHGYYRGDAVIVSTANGSTAYNYAAGGPVVSPSSDAVVITPLAPMSGISRPVVLGAQDTITLTIAEESAGVLIDVDGTPAGELKHDQRLTAAVRPDAAQVVRLSSQGHAHRSRVKLSLLDLPLREDQLLELVPPELRHRGKAAGQRADGA